MTQMLLPLVTLVSARVLAFQQFIAGKFGSDCFLVCKFIHTAEGHYEISILRARGNGMPIVEEGRRVPAEIRTRLKSVSFGQLSLLNSLLKDKAVDTVSFVYLIDRKDRLYLADIAGCSMKAGVSKGCILEPPPLPEQEEDYAAKPKKRERRPSPPTKGKQTRPQSSLGFRGGGAQFFFNIRCCNFCSRNGTVQGNNNKQEQWIGGNPTRKHQTQSARPGPRRRSRMANLSTPDACSSKGQQQQSLDDLIVTKSWTTPGKKRVSTALPAPRGGSLSSKDFAIEEKNQVVIRLPEMPADPLELGWEGQQESCSRNDTKLEKSRTEESAKQADATDSYYPVSKISISIGVRDERRRRAHIHKKTSPPQFPAGLVRVIKMQQMLGISKRTHATIRLMVSGTSESTPCKAGGGSYHKTRRGASSSRTEAEIKCSHSLIL